MVDQAEIHRNVVSGGVKERREAVWQLRSNFADLPDKEQAWKYIVRLTKDKNIDVRRSATDALVNAFPQIPDKKQAWKDLHRLTKNEYTDVRWRVANALGNAFPQIPDKKQAWKDLIRLTEDEYAHVRWRVADALGFTFPQIPDKKQACKDLIQLTQDENNHVRWRAADTLGFTFPHVPDKKRAWDDLIQLTQDENNYVRVSANHSLGRASIFKATEAENEEEFGEEIKNALEFFERSSKEAPRFNPSRFCLPFYRSFYSITFGKTGAEAEVQNYLAEAKSALGGSKNKEVLIEAVENLANALSEAHKITDFDAMKSDLNTYRRYCDRAADLIGDAAEGAPGAARILRRGLPIINDRIKEIIREIQEKAGAVCRETRGTGTPYEPLGMEVNKWAGELSDRDYLRNEKNVSRIINSLGEFCNLLPEGEKEYPCKIVEEIREEGDLEDKLSGIPIVLSYLLPSIKSEIQNAAKPTTYKTRSDEQPSQKTGHITTVFAESGSTVVVPQTETKSGDVTVNTVVTKESQPYKQPDRSSKRTAIEIFADIAVHVLVYTVLHHFAEDLMPVIAPILVLSALIILLLIIHNAKS